MTSPPLFNPYDQIGGREVVLRIARDFYAHMAAHEKELAEVHHLDASGNISEGTQNRFCEFYCEWLGGPPTYSPVYGHPRLRMRHGHVRVDSKMRDAWIRCMQVAFDKNQVQGEVRRFLDQRLYEVADFLRNHPD